MYSPYAYQDECLGAIQAVRDQGAQKALVVMASGLGKTVTMAFDAKRWRGERGGRVLFLCHNNDILYQAKTTFEAINGQEYSYGYFHGEEKHLHHVDFLFASFQTMERYTDQFNPKEFAYIVVDESHHSQADTYRSVIEYFQPQFLLGATATPDRLDELDIREVFGDEVFSLPLGDAMVRSLVTPVDYRLLTDEIQLSKELEAGDERVGIAQLNRSIFIPRRDEEIAKIISTNVSEFSHPRVIVFCNSISHCEHLAKFIPDSFAIHSKISERERAVRLEMFRQGLIGTVLTVDVFNEGIDIPQANVVVFLRSTVSQTIFLQQLGRGLRKREGKDKVVVLDFVANCERIKAVHSLWKQVEDLATSLARETESEPTSPMTLNVDDVNFVETIVPLLKLMDRVRPKRISEVPELLREYSDKNSRNPQRLTVNTVHKLWWKCSVCEHEWQASAIQRQNGKVCPGCAGKVATKINNLTVTHPRLALLYSVNNTVPADQVVATWNDKLYKWTCPKPACQHEWERSPHQMVSSRHDSSCPACTGHVITEKNNLSVTHPELAKEYTASNKFPVTQVHEYGPTSTYLVHWKCSKCGTDWQSSIEGRLRMDRMRSKIWRQFAQPNCPNCNPPVSVMYTIPRTDKYAGKTRKKRKSR